MDKNDVIHYCKERGIDQIRLGFITPSGEVRSKVFPVEELKNLFNGSYSTHHFALDPINWTNQNRIIIPDPKSFRDTSHFYHPEDGLKVAWMLGDVHDWNGEPSKLCSRIALKNALKGLPRNIVPQLGYEVEMRYWHGDDREISDTNAYYLNDDLDDHLTRTRILTADHIRKMGVRVASNDRMDAANGHEIALKHGDPLTVTDDLMLLYKVATDTAKRRQLVADFSPKPVLDGEGNALQLNTSLLRKNIFHKIFSLPGKNIFNDNGKLSTVANLFNKGITDRAALLSFIMNPTPGSYKRLFNAQHYAPDNATAQDGYGMIRTFAGSEEKSYSELRNGDNTMNPYLGSAAMFSAGMAGINGVPIDAKYGKLPESYDEALGYVEDLLNSGAESMQGISDDMLRVLITLGHQGLAGNERGK